MNIYLATGNPNKARELGEMLRTRHEGIHLIPASEVGGMPEIEENADTFDGNARLKARALREVVGNREWVLADDSGLMVDALGGAPGVQSARYAGKEADYKANNRKLLAEMESVPDDKRSARFVCCLIVIPPSGVESVFMDASEGVITREPRGKMGFGYDPIFIPEGFTQTFAELPTETKNRMSHRGRALADLAHWMRFHYDSFGAGV